MKIARLSERISIQKNEVYMDKYGNHKDGWKDWLSCFAYADTYAKDESNSGATTNEERIVTFEIRYSAKLSDISSTGYRVLFRGSAYDIVSADMMNYSKRSIRLKCRRVKA